MKKLLTFLAAFFLSISANAADIYKLDPNHININWSANHFGFSSPSGKFTAVDGIITIDEKNPQHSTVEVTIKIASLMTGIEKFDTHLKGADFFDADKFPTAIFISKSVAPLGNNRAKVSGELTLHGITKPIALEVKLNKIGNNPFTQRKTVGFSANTVIKRSDFNMLFGLPGVSDEVKIEIEAEGILVSSEEKSALMDNWKIIPHRSKIEFAAFQDNAKISGSFKKFGGKIHFDHNKPQTGNVAIEIDTTSVETSFSEAHELIQDATWLATKTFPTAIFKSERFMAGSGRNEFHSQGTLTIKGKSVPVNLEFTLQEINKTNAHATGIARIKRSDFNIGHRDEKQAHGVKDEVTVMIDVFAEK